MTLTDPVQRSPRYTSQHGGGCWEGGTPTCSAPWRCPKGLRTEPTLTVARESLCDLAPVTSRLPTFSFAPCAQPAELLSDNLWFAGWLSEQAPLRGDHLVSFPASSLGTSSGTKISSSRFFSRTLSFLTFQSKSRRLSSRSMFCHLHFCQTGHALPPRCVFLQVRNLRFRTKLKNYLFKEAADRVCAPNSPAFPKAVLERAAVTCPLCWALRTWDPG